MRPHRLCNLGFLSIQLCALDYSREGKDKYHEKCDICFFRGTVDISINRIDKLDENYPNGRGFYIDCYVSRDCFKYKARQTNCVRPRCESDVLPSFSIGGKIQIQK